MKYSKFISALIIITICFTLFSFSTAAAVSLEERGSVTLTALDKETKEPISGATFRIYRFASAYIKNDSISYIYTDDFKNNGMDISNFSDAYFPIHLMIHSIINAVAFEEKATDSSGRLTFDNLPCGAYLIVPVEMKDGYLNPSPFIATVPMEDESQNKWIYNIDASPKIECDKNETNEKTYVSVKKIWQTTEKSPDYIKVSLIKDGEIADSVILSAANNWYYRWDELDKNHSWSVIETDVPMGYNVSYETSQMTVIITNTKTDTDDNTTTSSDNTTTDNTTNPNNTTTTDTSTTKPVNTTKPTGTTESTTKPEELIHTGQLNWPIPVFSILGLILFSIGWAMLNFGKKDEETV